MQSHMCSLLVNLGENKSFLASGLKHVFLPWLYGTVSFKTLQTGRFGPGLRCTFILVRLF